MESVGLKRGEPVGRRPDEARWTLALYPEAGEAGGCLRPATRPVASGRVPDPERAADEAARRARAKIRRYCAANGLNRLATLTYAGMGCHDPSALRDDVAAFFKVLRAELGGRRFPYLWVPEWHPGGHGLHVHFAVGRFIKWTVLRDTWGRGRVHVKLIGDLPVGSGTLEEARVAARYLAKYAGKAIEADRPVGRHRYEVAQGFQPEAIQCYGPTAELAIASASRYMGRAPSQRWFSSREEGWNGPPACWVAWN